jgi:hypothetical protein
MQKTLFLAIMTIALFAISLRAEAGTVVLHSDTWDNICKVEIKWGTNAPDSGPSQSFENVEKGWKVSKADRICYRRSGQPSNCNSQMTAWNCCTHNISGTYECSLS